MKTCKDLHPSKPCNSCWMNSANTALYNNPSSATCYIIHSKQELERCYDNDRVKTYILKCLSSKYNDKIEYCYLAIVNYFPDFLDIYNITLLLM